MARKSETGIEYFPINADIVFHNKTKLVVAEFGCKTWGVLLPLLCKIYREKGYWIDWFDNDTKILFAQDECKCDLSFVNEVVNGCIRRSVFNKEVFDAFGILTSDRIQENYLDATKRRSSVEIIKEFLLVDDSVYNKHDNVNIIDLNVNIIAKNVDAGTQSKVKYSRVKESKGSGGEKPQRTPQELLEDRKKIFIEDIGVYLPTYGKEMMNQFFRYWTEPNKTKTKMRWELEKTWDLERRLLNWSSRENNFKK